MKILVEGKEVVIPNELIQSATQDMGAIFQTDLRLCTEGFPCPVCKELNKKVTYPHRYFAAYIKGEPSLIEINLRSGETIWAQEIISRED